MIRSFRLPVTSEQSLSVTYQKPADNAAPVVIPKKKKQNFLEDDFAAPVLRKPLIIMLHGFPGGHKSGCDDLFGEFEHRFAQLGYPSLRFDFRGTGESDGSTGDFSLESALEDLNAVIQWAQHDAGHRQFILLGESLGATVAVLSHNPKYVQALVLLWPAVILKETSFRTLFTHDARMKADARDAPFVVFQGHRMGVHFYNEIYKTDLTALFDKITVPVLLQHGTADEDVPLSQVYQARDKLAGMVDLAVFQGGTHGLPGANMREALYTNISYFLARVAKKLDSRVQN